MRTPPFALVLILVLCADGTAAAAGTGRPVEPTTTDLVQANRFGPLLEALPAIAAPDSRPRRVVRPERMERFRPGYVQCAALPVPTAGNSSGEEDQHKDQPSDASDRTTKVWLLAGQPQAASTFAYPCPAGAAATLRLWAFSGSDQPHSVRLPLEAGGRAFDIDIPRRGQQLLLYEIPLGSDLCGTGASFIVTIDGTGLPPDIVLSPPMIVVDDAAAARPPVILISLDTQRLDFWDGSASRPPSLQAFLRDAVQYRRAYSSFATTAQSHSVLFSGRFFSDVRRQPLDARLSFVSTLQSAGYVTMGFVAGGYMRAGFGFGRRAPGFAIGFDVYVEGMQLDDKRKEKVASRHATVLASEAALQTHTLGPGLERSLSWLMQHPTEPTFHFIQGYDVHEYRSVMRRYWDATVAERTAAGLDPAELDACLAKTGVEMDEKLVAHHRFEDTEAFRTRPLGDAESCHRLVASLMYGARVRSVEMALGRYLDALRALGVYDRALIIVTSDHGESLLDESGPEDTHPYWGHNRVLVNNLAIPLWIKLPGSRDGGTVVDDVAGLVDIPATIGDVLDLNIAPASGRSLVPPAPGRNPVPAGSGHSLSPEAPGGQRIVRFEDWRGEHGVVLPTGELCTWSHEEPHELSIHSAASTAWRPPTPEERARCTRARAGKLPAPPQQKTQDIPPEVVEELRALGYVE